MLDVRGVPFSKSLLGKVLSAVSPAPKYQARIRSARFNRATFGDWTSFSEAIFEEEADFTDAHFFDGVTFARTSFGGPTSFARAVFDADVDFSYASFRLAADFSQATFRNNARFVSLIANASIHFNKTSFAFRASFNEARFDQDVSFSDCWFGDSTSFESVKFDGAANFHNITCKSDVSFDGATLGHANFYTAKFQGPASFFRATFKGTANFNSAAFDRSAVFVESSFQNVHFVDAHFHGTAVLSLFQCSGRAAFDDARFEGFIGIADIRLGERSSAVFTSFKLSSEADRWQRDPSTPVVRQINEQAWALQPDLLRDLLPEEAPPAGLVPSSVGEGILLEYSEQEATLRHSALWMAALQTAFERSEISSKLPGFSFAAYGMTEPNTGREEVTFGVIVYASPTVAGPIGEITSLQVGNHPFPVVVRRPPEVITHHGAPPVVPDEAYWAGTRTCWAEVRGTALELPESRGFLTARHTLSGLSTSSGSIPKGATGPIPAGCKVRFMLSEQDSAYRLLKIGSDLVDAAVISMPSGEWRVRTLLPARRYVAAGTPAFLHGSHTQTPTTVVSVTDTRGTVTSDIQSLVFIVGKGRVGDSGALVSDSANQVGLGLYLGAFQTGFGTTEGKCQHLAQVQYVLDVVLYH